MDVTSLKNHLLVLLLVLLSATAIVDAYLELWHIHVVNGLSNGQSLFVHCKSKNDDLGEQNLNSNDEFNWSFHMNLWRTTLFWCYLRKPNAEVSFDVFWYESRTVWLDYRCEGGKCIWTAKDYGIYLRDIPVNRDVLIHPWVPTSKL